MTGRERATTLARMAYDNFLIDKRVVERNIKKGLVDPQQFAAQVESLPDREANCVHVSLEGGAQAQGVQSSSSDSGEELADEADELDDDEDDDEEDDTE